MRRPARLTTHFRLFHCIPHAPKKQKKKNGNTHFSSPQTASHTLDSPSGPDIFHRARSSPAMLLSNADEAPSHCRRVRAITPWYLSACAPYSASGSI
jgi:hypothetical protein